MWIRLANNRKGKLVVRRGRKVMGLEVITDRQTAEVLFSLAVFVLRAALV